MGIYDSNGEYKGADQASRNKAKNALESEFQDLIISMQNCWGKGYRRVHFESDCLKMIEIVNGRKKTF